MRKRCVSNAAKEQLTVHSCFSVLDVDTPCVLIDVVLANVQRRRAMQLVLWRICGFFAAVVENVRDVICVSCIGRKSGLSS
jgi:hypothetical protein